jgi:ABC-type glycerol-3-phosphate transport system permease component
MASLTQPLAITNTEARRNVRISRPRRRADPFRILAYAVLSFVAIMFVMPFIWMLLKSVMSLGEANSPSFIPTEFHFENYVGVLFDPDHSLFDAGVNFFRYLGNTMILEVLTVGGQTTIALLAAYGFSRIKFPGRDLVFSLFLITIFIPVTVTLVPKLIIVTNISRAFASINPSLAWIDNWPALVIPFLSSTFSIFLLRQFFMQVPEDLWEAARLDGAGHLRYLFAILVPISQAAVITTILFGFIGTWSAFEWPLLVTNTAAWRPIGVALYTFSSGEHAAQTNLLMAASVITLLPILLLYFFAQKLFIEGIATTGLKG